MTRTTKEDRDRWLWLASHYISQGELCCFNNKCVIDLLADFEELKSRLEMLERENEWLPIENCPKDAWYLLWIDGFAYVGEYVHPAYLGDNEYWSTSYLENGDPTHWKPLPAPPKAEKEPSKQESLAFLDTLLEASRAEEKEEEV